MKQQFNMIQIFNIYNQTQKKIIKNIKNNYIKVTFNNHQFCLIKMNKILKTNNNFKMKSYWHKKSLKKRFK